MTSLPSSWCTSALDQIGLPSTPNIDPSKSPDEIFELYSVPSFSEGRADLVRGSEIKSVKQIVQPGDVLLCKIVPHINRAWRVPNRGKYRQIASGEWIVVRPEASWVDPRYLRYALTEPGFRSQFMKTVSGVGGSLMRARPKAVAKIGIPLAPPREQSSIVAKLDTLFARSRGAREELAHVPKLVERYRQAVLSAAFCGNLTADWRLKGGVSQETSWQATTLNSLVLDVRYGTAAKCVYEPKSIPVLRIPNVVNGRIDVTDLKYGRFEKKEIEKLALRKGDILVIRSNGSLRLVGQVALVPENVAGYLFAGYLIRLRCDESKVLPSFIAFAFEEPTIRGRVERFAKSTSGVNNINSEQLRSLGLPLPSLPEQGEIVRRIRKAFLRINALSVETARAVALLDRLDQGVFAKAFRGDLVSRNQYDEPALGLGNGSSGEPRLSQRITRLGQPDGISPSRMAEMLEVDKAGPKVRC
jgi:type I restriction enzyme S subunit